LVTRFKDGLVFIDGAVNGARGTFLLDTGADATVLDPRFADSAFVRRGRARDIVGRGGDLDARQAEPVVLVLSGGPQERIAPLIADLSPASRAMGVPLAGILGEDFLRGYVLTIDYRGQGVAMAREAAIPPDATPILLGASPYVEARATLGGHVAEGLFEIDTGSNTAVEFWRPFARAAFGDGLGTRAPSLGVAGLSTIALGHVDTLEVAGRRIVGPEVNFADETGPSEAVARYGGAIGGPAWSGLVLTLDLPRRLMWVR
jgi:hypothetical protein